MIIPLVVANLIGGWVSDTSMLPPLHTLKDKNISTVNSSFEDQTITVKFKDSTTYVYSRIDWDFEDHYPTTPDRIRKAIAGITMKFTKVETPAQFPGGDVAWDKYLHDFCRKHRQMIGDGGPAEITVQFIVHMKGQVEQVQVIYNPSGASNELTRLAVEAIEEAPAWLPAHQNGRTVISYKKQVVILGL